MKKKLLISAGIPAVAAAFMLTGCFGGSAADTKEPVTSTSEESTQASETATDKSERSNVNTVEGSTIDAANMFTDRDLKSDYDTSSAVNITLNGTSASSDGDGVSIDGSNVTISKEGIYILTGALDNGTVKVEGADTDKIQIVLNNAVINSDTYAGIYVKNADKVFITTAEGTKNTVSNGGTYTQTDDSNVDGAIFGKDTITFNGKGTLNVTSKSGHGIVSKDSVKITDGGLNVESADTAIQGKDSVRIAGGDITIKAGGDGIHSENGEDTSLGFVYIKEGNINIDAYDDAIHAEPEILITGGNIDVTNCFEGYEANDVNIAGGTTNITASDDAVNAMNALRISDGKTSLDSAGDALDSNGDIIISGGETYASGATNDGNSVLDYDGNAKITGGVLVATGMSGMAQNMGNESRQGSILLTVDNQPADSTVEIMDEQGNVIASYTPPKAYNSVVISAPEITKGNTYTVTAGDTSTEVTMTDIIYGEGMHGFMMPGGNSGQKPGGRMESPDFKDDPRSINDESKKI